MAPILIDLHCHTREHSFDGKATGAEIVRGLVAAGFSGVVFTDHNEVWTAEELAALREECGVGPEFFLASGQEVRTAGSGRLIGDLLVYGPTEWIDDDTEPQEVIRLAREAGGFCIAAHPAVPLIGLGRYLGDYPVLAAEAWNGRYGADISAQCERLIASHGITAIGGSDTHSIKDIAGGGTEFPRIPADLADLASMIRAGDCRPWRPEGGGPVDWVRRFLGA